MRTFVKDGHEVETGSATQAVTLLAKGYRETTGDAPVASWSPGQRPARADTGPRTEVRQTQPQHQAPDTGAD
jgi:hypothetical protein